MVHMGIYHLFYQWNPKGAVWGNIVWAHSTSTDLINWIPHDPAIYPSIPSDINGCWSGSATILPGGKPVILYTGINEQGQQVQNLAIPKNLSDPFLREWIKSPKDNPVMAPNSINEINSSSFRDPTTAWRGLDGKWSVIVGSKLNREGKAILYRSKNFTTWTEAKQPLHSAADTGMWECPDFYPVAIDSTNGVETSKIGHRIKYVLKASLDDTKHEFYTIGMYDHDKDIYIPDEGSVEGDSGLRYDYGKFYASKTFFDSEKNRRVLWGWINESTNATIDKMKGWSGVQAIPRQIWLRPFKKQLMQWPVAELEKLRMNKVDVPNTVLKGGSVVEIPCVTSIQADVEIEFEISNLDKVDVLDASLITNPQELCSRNGASVRDYDKASFGAFVDIAPIHDKLPLRTLIDHSIVESFGGGGKACITSRVYPTLTLTEGAHTYAFNNGTESVKISKLTAWRPMVYKGIYHLFYQYNPKGADWGNIVWAHSTSRDLINWTPHPPAIYPSTAGDINGCWSGSATILPGGLPAILYTGIDQQNRQVQNLAVPKTPSDPLLIEWVKLPKNPLMVPTLKNEINSSSFRDPTTAWQGPDGLWRVIIGSKIDRRGLAILYKSKDFVNWILSEQPLHFAEGTGMWECPDFFPVSNRGGLDTSAVGTGIKHVLKLSLDDTKHDYYTIGTYDVVKDIYIPDEESVNNDTGLRYDYGKFYASKTFYDSNMKRRILWGWINESLPQPEYVKQGWSGIQAIPRSIWVDKSGKQLMQWPISEIETLRENQVNLSNKVLHGGSVFEIAPVTAAQADVEISFEGLEFDKAEVMDPSWTNPQLLCSRKDSSVKGGLGPFGLQVLASKGLKEYTAVFFRIFKGQNKKYVVLMCSDQRRSSLNEKPDKTTYGAFVEVDPVLEKLSLRSLIDHSIVESFGGEGKDSSLSSSPVGSTMKDLIDLWNFEFSRDNPIRKERGNAFAVFLRRNTQQ
ncbi:hypothetical protein RHMOL_Rhmol08G0310600 [Rhododendron molle]|uniref:Uncharacterized protein n=1 Tax=Rhododendron molle TaxID=49168 RepID=A0ACC0MVU4_RHOML|nr:hypothetical protein RHMOL_Rhmol08G0310600 [Rhododendron molle]